MASWSIQPFGLNRYMGWKLGLCPLSLLGELRPHLGLTQCRLGRCLPRTKWHLNLSSRLATTDMGRKLGAMRLLGELGPHVTRTRTRNTCRLRRGLPLCKVSSWSIQPFGQNTQTLEADRQHRHQSVTNVGSWVQPGCKIRRAAEDGGRGGSGVIVEGAGGRASPFRTN